ncbi:MAG TPA: PA domain-containing protein [Thermoanaerobaculia bacterium]
MKRFVSILLLSFAIASPLWAKTKITIVNADAAGTGFNDSTPATPVGGNSGTTLGQQRLNAFQRAADIWGGLLNSSVGIIVNAKFAPITSGGNACNILGQAGPSTFLANFAGAPKQNVWYPIALANALTGQDLQPSKADINAQFNAALDGSTCSFHWYYGFDGNHGGNVDLLVVLLHELGHGFGIAGTTDLTSGADDQNMPSVHELHTLDTVSGLHWDQMTDDQRRTSALGTRTLVWDGPSTNTFGNDVLDKVTFLTITGGAGPAQSFDFGTASFGDPATPALFNGTVVAATSGDGSATDGCTAFTNGGAVSGRIALVDRGNCNFTVKAANAQAAGARALIVVDDGRATCGVPPGMGGSDGSITIPTISVTQPDGTAIRNRLATGATAALRVDPSTMAGANNTGHLKLYAPCTLEQGSSVFHWDVSATPNLLMEPAINDDLGHGVDLTINQLIDMGWPRSADDGPPSGRRALRRH